MDRRILSHECQEGDPHCRERVDGIISDGCREEDEDCRERGGKISDGCDENDPECRERAEFMNYGLWTNGIVPYVIGSGFSE